MVGAEIEGLRELALNERQAVRQIVGDAAEQEIVSGNRGRGPCATAIEKVEVEDFRGAHACADVLCFEG